ncbi:MAG TPA: MarC family protein, partial [Verrucomicrobiae bacterium]|nr:MarC family protein [Verrucomicrobiae bacterium]
KRGGAAFAKSVAPCDGGRDPMQPYLEKFLLAFIPLFVAIDPIGLVAIFLGLGGQADARRRQHEGTLALITSLAVSIGFIFLGKLIFRALGITVSDFQVAGGLILLGIAVRELLDLGERNRYAGEAFGVVPLGMPLIAGPALLTALLLLVDTVGVLFTVLALLVNLLLVGLGFRYASHFTRWMGQQGMRGVSKLISLLLAAIAVSLIRRGWQTA